MNKLYSTLSVSALGLAAFPAFAQTTIDTTEAVTNIGLATAGVGVVGAAIIGVIALVKGWALIKAAIV